MVSIIKPLPELQDFEPVVDRKCIRQVFGISVWKGGIAVTFRTVEISVPYAEQLDTVSTEIVKA